MNFVSYSSNLFNGLNWYDNKIADINNSIILQASTSTLYVNSITVCNTTANNIGINLQRAVIRTAPAQTTTVQQVFLVQNFSLPTKTNIDITNKNTANLVSLFGLEIFLPLIWTKTISGITYTYTSALLCFSNTTTQLFDCTVDYTTFVETPINFS